MMRIYCPAIAEMDLYVPKTGTHIFNDVIPASAVVGVPGPDSHIRCYYEGGMYQAIEFHEKIAIACGRLADRAPTTAFAHVPTSDLAKVGTVKWDAVLRAWIINEITDPSTLEAWAKVVPELNGTRSQRERAAGLIIDNGKNQKAIIAWQAAIRANLDPVEELIKHARSQQ